MTERRRSFYGWGYEDYRLPAGELAWFERACSTVGPFPVTPVSVGYR